MDENRKNNTFLYLQAFDNYIKHIKTILVSIKNSFLLGSNNEFLIRDFVYDHKSYPPVSVLEKVKEVNDYVQQKVLEILSEVKEQLPNCLDNKQRIQNIAFKQVVNKNPNGLNYISFFIDVQNDLSELPKEIKVFPLIVKPSGDIYSFDFRFDKIFIRKKGSKAHILGCAELKNGLNTNEFYRIYKVHPCGIEEYQNYIFNFAKEYSQISLNYNAMEGSIIFCED